MRHPLRDLSLTVAVLFAAALPAHSQIQNLPRVSQRARTSQVIGVSEVEVVYHRPGVKGREIWGDLVPYGQIWRAGANENTVLVLSHPATIEGKPVAAGMYGLHMIPSADTWTVILSLDSSSWGSFAYEEKLDVLRAEVEPEPAAFKEWLQYEFDPHSDRAVTLALRWEKLRVPVRIEFATPELVLAKIREDLEGPFADRWQTWHDAAKYCADSGIYTEEALGWIDRAIETKRFFATLRIRADLLAGLGREDEARQTLDAALEMGNANEIAGLGSQLVDSGDLERAAMFLELALAKSPQLWWAWVRLGDAQAGLGDVEGARASYEKGLELAPDERRSFVEALRDKLGAPR